MLFNFPVNRGTFARVLSTCNGQTSLYEDKQALALFTNFFRYVMYVWQQAPIYFRFYLSLYLCDSDFQKMRTFSVSSHFSQVNGIMTVIVLLLHVQSTAFHKKLYTLQIKKQIKRINFKGFMELFLKWKKLDILHDPYAESRD